MLLVGPGEEGQTRDSVGETRVTDLGLILDSDLKFHQITKTYFYHLRNEIIWTQNNAEINKNMLLLHIVWINNKVNKVSLHKTSTQKLQTIQKKRVFTPLSNRIF